MQDDNLKRENVVNDQKVYQNQKKRVKMESRLKPEKDGCPSYTAMIAEAIMRILNMVNIASGHAVTLPSTATFSHHQTCQLDQHLTYRPACLGKSCL